MPPYLSPGHLRRRSSSGGAELSHLLSAPPISPTNSTFSDSTAYEDEPEPKYVLEKEDHSSVRIHDDDLHEPRWRQEAATAPRRRRVSSTLCAILVTMAAIGGWATGSSGASPEVGRVASRPTSRLPTSAMERCDPYEQHGYLCALFRL